MTHDVAQVIKVFRGPGEIHQREIINELFSMGITGRDIMLKIYSQSDSVEARRWAISGLGKYNDLKSRKIIRASLADNAMSIRLHAIRAIVEIGDKRLGLAVIPLIDDVSGGIRINALDAIVKLGVSGWRSIVHKCLDDPKDYVRTRARFYLSHVTV
jgi:HEAT repeat protein